MYLCVCRAITDHRVKSAVIEGAETVGAVFRACGTAPNCGSCVNRIRGYIDDVRCALAPRDWAVAAE